MHRHSMLMIGVGLVSIACTQKPTETDPKPPPAPAAEAKPAASQPSAAAPHPSAGAGSQPAAGAASQPGEATSRPAQMEGLAEHKTPETKEPTLIDGLKNVSGVEYTKEGCDGKAPCECAGTLVYGQNALKKAGITEPMLAEGVPCVVGDYDGNGTADFAFLQAEGKDKPAVDVQVLMFDPLGLTATAQLPKKMTSLGRVRVGKKDVLVEPAAASAYHFAYDKGRFTLVRGAAAAKPK